MLLLKRTHVLSSRPRSRAALTGLSVAGVLAAAIASTGCSKQQFVKQDYSVQANAVGYRTLPAKVDILMVPDNTGSTNNIFPTLQSSFSSFITSLQNQYWDYHVGRSPVYYPSGSQPSPGLPILVNPQFNVSTLSDGTSNPVTQDLVPSQYAETNAANFPILEQSYQTGNGDNTYSNTIAALQSAQNAQTNFLRADAMLAIIVVTNGYDSSVTDQYGNFTSNGSSNLQFYANEIAALKGRNPELVRFYPVAAYSYESGAGSTYCLQQGGQSFVGTSYFSMSNYLLGMPMYDQYGNPTSNVCSSSSLSSVLADIANNLTTVSQAYVYSNIVLNDAPVPGSIQVTKNGATVPQDPNNGWEYMGYGTAYTVTGIYNSSTGKITALSPGLNQETGYVIQLNGNAQMVGSDVPNVNYQKQ